MVHSTGKSGGGTEAYFAGRDRVRRRCDERRLWVDAIWWTDHAISKIWSQSAKLRVVEAFVCAVRAATSEFAF